MASKVSDLVVRCLEKEGVRYVFGVPGEETEDLLFSLEKSSIQFIPTRHEQGAAFMANVWGRLSGKAGVCLSTLGPGATNLMTGVADAYLDKSPLVALTGQGAMNRIHQESHQYIDIVNMFRPITKWNGSISHPDVVPEMVRKAFKIAEMEKPGATHLEIPEDIAKSKGRWKPIPAAHVRRPGPDETALNQTVALLKKSKRPLILAGNGAIRNRSSLRLRELTRKYKIPVVHTFMGQGAVSDDCPESLLSIGLPIQDFVNVAVDRADLVLTVGYDIAEYSPSHWNHDDRRPIVHIDFEPAEVYMEYLPEVELIADISASLQAILDEMSSSKVRYDEGWYRPFRKTILDDLKSYELKKGDCFTIPGVLNLLRRHMGEDDLLISDVGTHKFWIGRNFPVHCPNGVITSNGLASMGIALPGAIAAKLQNPKRRVVAASGDGGFLMNVQELETAKRLGVAFTYLIFNDNDYGQINWKQRFRHGHATGTQLGNPDFKRLAESFGHLGFKPKSVKELNAHLNQAQRSGRVCVIEIEVDQTPTMKLREKLKTEIKRRGRA